MRISDSNSTQQVAAERIGAHQVHRVARITRADQVQIGFEQAPHLVLAAAGKELDVDGVFVFLMTRTQVGSSSATSSRTGSVTRFG